MASIEERARIVALDKRFIWHPYTAMEDYQTIDPFVIERAEGSRLFDMDGKAYLDGNASWWVSTLGHCHPRLVAALKNQADILCHTALAGITHRPAAQLAEALVAAAPKGLEHVFYSDDGSTAVEVAMKLALQYWAQNGRTARKSFVALEGAFHGETLGVTSLGGIGVFHEIFEGGALRCWHIPSPAVDYDQSLEQLETRLRDSGDEIAGVILEPLIQGAAGMRIYPPEFLSAARVLCDRYETFLIFDEVFTGYGRTGKMWAADHAGVSPDILCSAKGFSGGMLPMAVTLVNERVYSGFFGERERAFYYGHSFCGNPLGCAIALEVLRVFEEESILENLQPKAKAIARAFSTLGELEGVLASRSLGMVGALELDGDSGYLAQGGWQVFEEARQRGAYLRPMGNLVYVTPPLNIPSDDLKDLLRIVEESVQAVVKEK